MTENDYPTTITVISTAGTFISDPEPEADVALAMPGVNGTLQGTDGTIRIPHEGGALIFPTRSVLALQVNWNKGHKQRLGWA